MTRSPSELLGRKEDQRLEFKSGDALKQPSRIARAVVAMLNSGLGGEIWIGVAEKDGRADRLEPLEDLARKKSRLWDHLVDSIDPSPLPDEVDVEEIAAGEGGLLVIRVGAGPRRGPYAFLREGGRHFVVRVAERVRPMSRQEIFMELPGSAPRQDSSLERARNAVSRRCEKVRQDGNAWMLVKPAVDQSLELSREQVERLSDPTTTGNRRMGWHYARTFAGVERVQGVNWRIRSGGRQTLLMQNDGTLELTLPLSALFHPSSTRSESDDEIFPYALLEYPVSVLRLFRAVQAVAPRPRPSDCVVGFAMFGLQGWKLRPFSPRSPGYRIPHPGYPHQTFADKDLIVDPLVVAWEDIVATDDRVALRLVRQVYAWFGYEPDAIPEEFDQDDAVLRLGE